MNKIRLFRVVQNYGFKKLATDCGISEGHLSHLENCTRNPSKAVMERVAHALGKTVQEVFYDDFTAQEVDFMTENSISFHVDPVHSVKP